MDIKRSSSGQRSGLPTWHHSADSANMSFAYSRSGSRSDRRARRRQLLRLLLQKAKRKLKLRRERRSAPTEEQKIASFCKWCAQIGLELHPKIRIGRLGSCSEIGVVALDDIAKGECLAVIPREELLSCRNSNVASLVAEDKRLMTSSTSSWVPLLITLAAEATKKESSRWRHYLSLVPNLEESSPPMLWAESERHRLLEGTGLEERVERDLKRIKQDFTELVLPFMQRHPQHFNAEVQSLPTYLRLVAMVMSYSFTDSAECSLLSQTMMVPFVDLLNHHSSHHVELKFTKSSLRLMVIRHIKKGEEVMNTYGSLSNASLLHTYGFTEEGSPCDEALISVAQLKNVFLMNCSPQIRCQREERWKAIENDDILEDDYSILRSGKPQPHLLDVIRWLHTKEYPLTSSLSRRQCLSKVSDLSSKERSFLRRLAEDCLLAFPGNQEEILTCTRVHTAMTAKECHAHILSEGQQNCLRALIKRLDDACGRN